MNVEEALALAKESEEDTICVIDTSTRKIDIPLSLSQLGVEHDKDSTVIQFEIPNIFDEDMQISIPFMNANGEKDRYIVEDATVDDRAIRFSWLINDKATLYKGPTAFAVCLRKVDEDGNIIRDWNTTVAYLDVLEGLDADIQLPAEKYDIITQLLSIVDGNKKAEEQRVQNENERQANEQIRIQNEQARLSSDRLKDAVAISRFSKLDDGTDNIEIAYNGTDIYVGTYSYVNKIDASVESDLKVTKKLRLQESSYSVTGLRYAKDYLFACDRLPTAGVYSDPEKEKGHLYVISPSTMEVKYKEELPWKGTKIIIKDDIMVVCLQMYGFSIYDISEPTNPVLQSTFTNTNVAIGDDGKLTCTGAMIEWQGGQIIERDSKRYLISAGFGCGVNMHDITDLKNPKRLNNGGYMFAWYKGVYADDGASKPYGCHTYDLVVKGDYVYATIAGKGTSFGTEFDKRGILCLDISDITVYKYENRENLPVTYIPISQTDYDGWLTKFYNDGDPKPTKLAMSGNHLVVNTGSSCIAIYDISNGVARYVRMVNVSDGGIPFPIVATDDGRIVIGDFCCDEKGLYIYRKLDIY